MQIKVDDRVFQTSGNWTIWGRIAESAPDKVVIKWDTTGSLGQSHTTFHGNLSAITRFRDCWEVKL